MPVFRWARGLGAAALAAAALTGPAVTVAGAAATPAHGIVPPHHPGKNLPPQPPFYRLRVCAGGGDGPACNTEVRRAAGRARRVLERLGGMSFSLTAYEKLTPDEQLFVAANLERTGRGLPAAVVLSRSLDKVAQAGANADGDPPLGRVPDPLPGGGRWVSLGGNWAGGWANPLGADYGWMYDDGPGWGHRDNILGRYVRASSCGGGQHEVVMGAGHVARGKKYGDSETELFAGVCGHTPTDVVMTWPKAKRLLHIRS